VTNHIDIRNIGKSAQIELSDCGMDVWVGENCGLITAYCFAFAWPDYIDTNCGGQFMNGIYSLTPFI